MARRSEFSASVYTDRAESMGSHMGELQRQVGPQVFRAGSLLLAAGVLIAMTGCYNGDALVQTAHSHAVQTRLAEVDLGSFHTTLPRDAETGAMTDLKLHIFGNVPRYRVPEVKNQLRAEEYRLRAETLSALRSSTRDELAEPNFAELRERIERVVNEILKEAPIKSVGFYEVSLRQH
jgi:hypothetical protein